MTANCANCKHGVTGDVPDVLKSTLIWCVHPSNENHGIAHEVTNGEMICDSYDEDNELVEKGDK